LQQSYILKAESKRIAVIVTVMKSSIQPLSTSKKHFQKLLYLAQWHNCDTLCLRTKIMLYSTNKNAEK